MSWTSHDSTASSTTNFPVSVLTLLPHLNPRSCGRRPVTGGNTLTPHLPSRLRPILYKKTPAPKSCRSAIGFKFRSFCWPDLLVQSFILSLPLVYFFLVSLCDQHFCQRFVMISTFSWRHICCHNQLNLLILLYPSFEPEPLLLWKTVSENLIIKHHAWIQSGRTRQWRCRKVGPDGTICVWDLYGKVRFLLCLNANNFFVTFFCI